MRKRFFVLATVMFLATMMLPVSALAASPLTALSTVTGASLSEGAVYSISTEAELAKLAELVNGGEDCTGNTFVLIADISLSVDHNGASAGKWVPIGNGVFSTDSGTDTSGSPFNGSFFGQHHSISGLDSRVKSCSGLFGYIGSAGLVTDLTVSGVTAGATLAGGIAAINQGEIVNCINHVNYTNDSTTAYAFIGGIVGANQGTVQNCINNGAILGYVGSSTGDTNIGGLAGYCKDSATVLNSINTASIYGWENIGGIVGSTHPNYWTIITNCYNTGDITAHDICGGIIGLLDSKSQVHNCYFAGTITVDSSTNSGAIAGLITTACSCEESFYLSGSFSKAFGTSSSDTFWLSTFSGTDLLLSDTPPWGSTSLYQTLNGYLTLGSSSALRDWAGGSVLPYFASNKVIQGPSDAYVAVGTKAPFSVLVVGEDVSYQWQVSEDGSSWANVTTGYGYDSPIYVTPSVTEEMDGLLYRCLVDGTTLTDDATLKIGAVPVITTQPVDAYAKEGDPISVFIEATGSPAPDYSWNYSFDGVTWDSMYTGYPEFGVDEMDPMLDGVYFQCVAFNKFGSATSDIAQFHIATAPVITTQPSDKTATVGKTATFSVTATGGPAPTYQWQVNRGSGWSNLSSATKSSYTTAKVTLLNEGYQYRVLVSNVADVITSDAATLHVLKAAEIPSTGDTAQPELWLCVGIFALTGLVVIAMAFRIKRTKHS